MKIDKKFLALIFIVSIFGLGTEAVAMSDIRRESILFSIMEWLNYISPNLSLLFMDNRAIGQYNHSNMLVLNYCNVIFYLFLFIGGIFYILSRGKETRLIRFSFAVILLNKLLLFLFIVPGNLMYYEQVKQIPYIAIRIIYFLFNHALWIYLSYYVITQLTKDRVLEILNDNGKSISSAGLVDAPRGQRFTHLIIDSVFCLLTSSFFVYNIAGPSFLLHVESMIGQRASLYILFFICTLIYYIFFEALFGSTPAKFLTESRVVSLEGKKISLKQATLRTLYRHVPFANLSFLFGPDGAHDYWTNTIVVKEKRIGVKANAYLLFFPFIGLFGLGSFWAYGEYKETKANDRNKKEYAFKMQNLQNELSHLDTTVVLQLSNVTGYEDSIRFVKVESVQADTVAFKLFKRTDEYGQTYQIECEYLLLPATLPTVKVPKSIFKNYSVLDYDNHKKGQRKGEPFFGDDQKYEINKIHRLFGPNFTYDNNNIMLHSDANGGLRITLFNEGSSGQITAIENLKGTIKWTNAFPMQIEGLDKSRSQANISLEGENFEEDEKYTFLIHVKDLQQKKQTYKVELENKRVFISRVFE